MIAMVGLGAVTGGLLFALLSRLRPPQPSPLVQLARFDAGRDATLPEPSWAPAERADTRSDGGALGHLIAHVLARRGIACTGLRQDLALTGRSFEATLARKVILFLAGFLLSLVTVAALRIAAGFDLPTGSPLLIALLVGAGFFLLPDLDARTQANRRRRDLRRALGA